MTTLLLGATGLVGAALLDLLVADERITRVVTLTRRTLPSRGPAHEPHVVDFDALANHADLFDVDVVFCALGTTMKQAGSKEAFRRVDFAYPLEAARLAHAQGVSQFEVVTALGADPSSMVFYNRVKGEVEEALRQVGFEHLTIFRPSLLVGDRDEDRPGERIAEVLLRVATPFLRGPLRKYRPTPVQKLAEAMHRVAHSAPDGIRIYEADEIATAAR